MNWTNCKQPIIVHLDVDKTSQRGKGKHEVVYSQQKATWIV